MITTGSIQQPLYQILVPMESILVPSCHDTGYMQSLIYKGHLPQCSQKALPPKVIGWDMEPTQMSMTSQDDIFQEILNELAVVSLIDVKPHLWNDEFDSGADKMALRDLSNGSFVATLEQGTSTGVLRQHILRLNSSVVCERIERAAFPSPCPGEYPFTRMFSHDSNVTRVCVPGTSKISPWTMSRSRQDIVEELYLDILEELEFSNVRSVDYRNLTSDYTLHCTVSTTRGYFELGNYRNNDTWGPLLDTWPSSKEMETEYNDFLDFSGIDEIPYSYGGRFPSQL